jgi:type I restriction enzyme M protein
MISSDSPFNDSDLFSKDDDVRWQWSGARLTTKGSPQGERSYVYQFGVPPKGNANFAWVQHFIHHLAPQTGGRDTAFIQSEASPQVVSEAKDNMAGFILDNGSMSSNQSGEGNIRRALIESDLVDRIVSITCQLVYTEQIPVCLSGKNEPAGKSRAVSELKPALAASKKPPAASKSTSCSKVIHYYLFKN